MDKRILKSILLFTGFFCAFVSTAQKNSGKDDLLRMNETYAAAKSYSMNIAVKVYGGKSSTVAPALYDGNVKKSIDGYFASMKGITIIVNDHCSMMIDDNQKQIVYGSSNSKTNKLAAQGKASSFLPDSTLFAKDQIVLKFFENGHKQFLVKTPGNTFFDKVEITMNMSTGTLDEIVYYYKASDDITGSKVIVSYTDVKINSQLPSSIFSEKSYMVKRSEQLRGVGKYSAYKIVDSTKKLSNTKN